MNASTVGTIAAREVRVRVRTRLYKAVTVLLALAGVAGVVIPGQLGDDGPSTLDVRFASDDGAIGPLRALGAAFDLRVRVIEAPAVEAEAAVVDGSADAAVIDGEIVLAEALDPLPLALLQAALTQAGQVERLAELGVAAPDAAAVLTPDPVPVRVLDAAGEADGDRAGLAFLSSLLLYLALLLTGQLIAVGVVEEKATQLAEVLLVSVRPAELLAGKVLGIGVVGLSQVLAIAAPSLVAAGATGADVPGGTIGLVASSVVWFVAGYGLYGCAYAGLGALVSRTEDIGVVVMPLTFVLIGGYFVAIVAIEDPDALLPRVLSLVPLTAPLVMPVRTAVADVPFGELAAAWALMAVATLVAIRVGARLYRGGVARTGPRLKLREAWRTP